MDENIRNPQATQGAVVLTCQLDKDGFRARSYRSSSADSSISLIPGSDNERNFDILNGELVFATKEDNVGASALTMVFSSLNGMEIREPHQMENRIFFVGVAPAGVTYKSDMQNDQSLAVNVCGSHSIVNTGDYDFEPGDLICWEIQDPNESGRFVAKNIPKTKFRPRIVPFHVSMLKIDPIYLIKNMKYTEDATTPDGIKDLTLTDVVDGNCKFNARYSPDQIEAAGLQFGMALAMLKGLEYLADKQLISLTGGPDGNVGEIESKLGIFSRNNDVVNNLLSGLVKAMIDTKKGDGDSDYDKHKGKALKLIELSRAVSLRSKTSRIIGRAQNYSAARGGTLDALIGYTQIA